MNGQLELDLRPPAKQAMSPEPEQTAIISEALVIAAEQLSKVEDALQLTPQELERALSAHNPDVFQAIKDGCTVEEALALVKLDEG